MHSIEDTVKYRIKPQALTHSLTHSFDVGTDNNETIM